MRSTRRGFLLLAGATLLRAAPPYDPKRNPAEDLKQAEAEARRTHKRILLDVGGEWCIWCHALDRFFDEHPDLLALREKHYVMMKVNFSEENRNQDFLSHYPKVPAYPHLFVLDADGKLLHAQGTGVLEKGRSYDPEKMAAFLKAWAR